MTHLIISHAQESEYREIRALWLQALAHEPHAFKKSYAEELLISESEWKRKLSLQSCEVSHDFFMVAKLGGSIVGMVGSECVRENVWKLHSVYVDQQYRGQGIGRTLVNAIVGFLEDIVRVSKIELVVNAQQVAAIRVYLMCGFVVDEIVENQTSGDGNSYSKFCMSRTGSPYENTLSSGYECVRSRYSQSTVFSDNNILRQ